MAYKGGSSQVQEFIRHLSLFTSVFLRNHLASLEGGDANCQGALLASLAFLLRISSVDDVVIFKICLEYWIHLV
jgi:hypothetical protein